MSLDADSPAAPLERVLLVTGRLAEGMVRRVAEQLNRSVAVTCDVAVVGISVAALMHVDWLRRKLLIEGSYDRVLLPGWCQGDIAELTQLFGVPFELGPKEIMDLPAALGHGGRPAPDLSRYDIEIIAEINHAPQLSDADLVRIADEYRQSGADMIDMGAIPGSPSPRIGPIVRLLREHGHRVSIDSFDRAEVEAAVDAGAELVLSCNSSNVDWARNLNAEWVVIPDDPQDLSSLRETARTLTASGRNVRLDPILEPIGFRFAASLARYYEVRRESPASPMLMGTGNVTELTEVDSAGLNFLLAAICQELRIHSILTTQVINWCRSSIAEFDKARRLVKYALEEHVVPKRLTGELVMLRDPQVTAFGNETLDTLAENLKDANYRIFVERGRIHVMNRDGYWQGTDPYELFDAFSKEAALDASHAFYLGYELSKAVTALTLGKQYQQDQALRWGFLTVPETSAHERRRKDRDKGER